MANTQIHFIIGIGRSGTTLLTSILNQHKEILAAPENFFLLFFANAYRNKNRLTDSEIEQLLKFNRLFGEIQPYIGWYYDEAALRRELQEKRNAGYTRICEIVYRHFQIEGKDSIHHIVDKNPAYSLQAERLSNLFPSAKFLVAVRDYRANLLSRKQSVNVRAGDTVLNSIRWDLFNKFLIRFMKRNPGKFHVVTYENMVTQAEVEVKSMMAFLHLEYSESLLNFHQREKEKLSDSSYQDLSKTSDRITKKYTDMARPINASRMEAWKTELSAEDIRIADIICGETGKYFGYKMQNEVKNRRGEKLKIYFSHPKQVMKAYYDIYKDFILYYAPVNWKLKRFEKVVTNRLQKHRDGIA